MKLKKSFIDSKHESKEILVTIVEGETPNASIVSINSLTRSPERVDSPGRIRLIDYPRVSMKIQEEDTEQDLSDEENDNENKF